MLDKLILDASCGGKTFWFNKNHPNAVYLDRRFEEHKLDYKRNKQHIIVNPDIIGDFTELPFDDGSFKLVVFDPPHKQFNQSSIMYKKYGTLDNNWKDDLRKGFKECFRVLEDNGVLIFKWAESGVKVEDVLSLTDVEPLFGHRTTRTTVWITFMKI